MKVMVFCPWAHSTSYYTSKFCNALAADGVSVFLVMPDNFMAHLLSDDIETVRWPYVVSRRASVASILESPLQAIRLLQIVYRIRPDWIHFLWLHQVPSLVRPWLRRFRVAYTAHNPVLHSGEAGIARRWIQKQHVNMARICFVHGERNKRELLDEYGIEPERVHIVPHGEFMFWPEIPDIDPDKRILFFGRIRRYKGVEVLLDAFEKVGNRIPDYSLLICGEGDLGALGDRARSMANVEVINRFIDHAEVPSLFLGSQFLVLPYLDGTQSGVVPMAFALGRTCVVSAVGSIPEVVHHEDNGLLVRPGDSGELAEAMVRLANDGQLRRRLEKAALRSASSSDSLSWELAARKTIAAYSSTELIGCQEPAR